MADEIVAETTEEIVEEVEVEETLSEGESESDLSAEDTVEPDSEEEVVEPDADEEAEAKPYTQEEIDAIVEKRLARERRKQAREAAEAAQNAPPLEIESQINPDDYDTTEAYIEALVEERTEAVIKHREQSKSVNAVEKRYQEQVDEALDKYPDYEQVAHTHQFMTNEMAAAIKASDISTEIAYYLGSNLDEAEKIFNLQPIQQVKELGKLEARLESNPPVKKTTKAPAPIKPVGKAKVTVPSYDTTDPRSVKKMSPSEWIAADRKRKGFQ